MPDSHDYSTRRRFRRHPGSFDAWRVGAERNVLQIKSLNPGGCFILGTSVTGFMETFELRIDLGEAGLLEVSARTLYHTADGTAVTFQNLNQLAFDQIQRAVDMAWEMRARR